MFYCQQILAKQGVFGTIWIIGTLKNAKGISRKQLQSLHITKLWYVSPLLIHSLLPSDRVREPMSALALRTRAILLFGIVVVFGWHCETTKNEAELLLMSRLKSFPNHTLEGDGTAPESSITLPFNPLGIEPIVGHPYEELPDFNDEGLLMKPLEPPETEIMRFSVQNNEDITLLPSLPQGTPLPVPSSPLDLLSSLSSISFSSLSQNEEQPVAVVIGNETEGLDVVPDIPLPEFLSKSMEETSEALPLPQKELFSSLPPIQRNKRYYTRKAHQDQITELSELKIKKFLLNTHKITGRTRRNKLLESIDDDLFEAPTHFFHPSLSKTLQRSMEFTKLSKLEELEEVKEVELPMPQCSPRTEKEQPRSEQPEPFLQEDFLPPVFLEREYIMQEPILTQRDTPPQEMEESQPETLVSFSKDTAKLLRYLQKKVPGEAAVEFTSCLPRAKRGTAAKAFYHLMELTSISAVAISQAHHYGPITLHILLEITNPTPNNPT